MENRPAFALSDKYETVAVWIRAIATHQNRTAFANLFSYYAPRVKSYLRRMRVEEQLAEELTQEVMLLVWRKAPQFDSTKASVGTWIFTIARNRFIDAIRHEKRFDPSNEEATLIPQAPVSADNNVATRQIGEKVRAALATLPHDQAEIIRLSFMEGMTHSVISEELGIPLGTVKSRIRLAFGRLRPVLKDLQ